MSIVWSIDGGNEDEENRRKEERKVLQKISQYKTPIQEIEHHISERWVLSQLWNLVNSILTVI